MIEDSEHCQILGLDTRGPGLINEILLSRLHVACLGPMVLCVHIVPEEGQERFWQIGLLLTMET